MKNPLVSIIIPTHNRCSWLDQAIQSVLQQTWRQYEILIVDDASDDDTRKLVESFQANSTQPIHYIKTPGDRALGVSRARNLGIKKSQGDFLAFLDSDDRWLPHKLELQLKALEEN